MWLDSAVSQDFKYLTDTAEVKLSSKLDSGAEMFQKSGSNYQNTG